MDSVSVKVRPSNVHGRGVFALQDIKVGEFVCIHDGEILSNDVIRNSSVDVDVSLPVLPHTPKESKAGALWIQIS